MTLWALVKVRVCKGQMINGDLVHICFPVGLLDPGLSCGHLPGPKCITEINKLVVDTTFELWCWRKSLGQRGDQTSQS